MKRHHIPVAVTILASILLLAASPAWAGPIVTARKTTVNNTGITLPPVPLVTDCNLVNNVVQIDALPIVNTLDLSGIVLEPVVTIPELIEVQLPAFDLFGSGSDDEDKNHPTPIVALVPPDPPDNGATARNLCVDLDGDGKEECF